MGHLARLRGACEEVLRDIDVPDPFDLAAFCDDVARRRGRPLHLHPLPLPASAGAPCGLWLATDAADHIFHVTGTTPLHRQHIVLHELGHLLCGHVPGADGDLDWSATLLPDLDPNLVVRVLGRTSYEAWQEQMAEMMASLILGSPERRNRRKAATRGQDRLADVFGLADEADIRG